MSQPRKWARNIAHTVAALYVSGMMIHIGNAHHKYSAHIDSLEKQLTDIAYQRKAMNMGGAIMFSAAKTREEKQQVQKMMDARRARWQSLTENYDNLEAQQNQLKNDYNKDVAQSFTSWYGLISPRM